MNYRLIAFVFGEIAVIMGAIMCIPMFMALGYGENYTVAAFGIAIGVCVAIGGIGLALRPPKNKRDVRPSSGFAICGMLWIVISLLGALPYCISGYIPNFLDALFETISGFTTTGATILTDVEALPKSLLFWRSITQWLGGMGVLVFAIALLPKNDKMSTALAKAEIPGPQFGKLVSKLRFTSRILYAIYVVLTLVLAGILCICKMPVFDSFCHAFTTASTGGFSIKNLSIAYYNSVSIEIVLTIFMLLFSINFNIFFMILIGRFLKAIRSEEFICMFIIFFVATAAIAINLAVNHTYDNAGDAIRYSAFNIAGMISTTCFANANADFSQWPILSQVILIAVMCIGGSAGSTAGGIKVSRLIITSKSSLINLRKTLSPRSVYSVKMDGKPIGDDTVANVQNFFVLYIIIIVVSTLLVSIQTPNMGGSLFENNLTAVLACINNIGPGLGAVGPMGNYTGYGVFSKIIFCIDMLVGRLEILPILLMFSPKSWKRI